MTTPDQVVVPAKDIDIAIEAALLDEGINPDAIKRKWKIEIRRRFMDWWECDLDVEGWEGSVYAAMGQIANEVVGDMVAGTKRYADSERTGDRENCGMTLTHYDEKGAVDHFGGEAAPSEGGEVAPSEGGEAAESDDAPDLGHFTRTLFQRSPPLAPEHKARVEAMKAAAEAAVSDLAEFVWDQGGHDWWHLNINGVRRAVVERTISSCGDATYKATAYHEDGTVQAISDVREDLDDAKRYLQGLIMAARHERAFDDAMNKRVRDELSEREEYGEEPRKLAEKEFEAMRARLGTDENPIKVSPETAERMIRILQRRIDKPTHPVNGKRKREWSGYKNRTYNVGGLPRGSIIEHWPEAGRKPFTAQTLDAGHLPHELGYYMTEAEAREAVEKGVAEMTQSYIFTSDYFSLTRHEYGNFTEWMLWKDGDLVATVCRFDDETRFRIYNFVGGEWHDQGSRDTLLDAVRREEERHKMLPTSE